MSGGELVFHFINVMLMTVLVSPLILWRYRRAVLAGMQDRGGAALLPVPAAARATDCTGSAAQGPSPDVALAWEARLRRRIFAAVLAALFPPAMLLAAHYLYLGQQPITPAHLFLAGGVTCSMAVPIFAVLTATPFWRALRSWLITLFALAAFGVLLSMLQQPFYGKAPRLDQAMNFVLFLQLAAYTLWLPMLLGLAIGARRVRGVAPLAFAGLLVFAIAPLLGVRLTQWLSGMRWSASWVLAGPGIDAGFVVLALPIGLLAWWRLKGLADAYEAKRFSDAQLLAHSWWLLVVASRATELASVYPGTGPLLQILAVSVVAYLLFPPLLARALGWAHSGAVRPTPRTLLLLRVFGDTARTEALFDRIASRWQRFGPVTMIAAPDVVARTVDPGDVLRFATGNIAASFIKSQADLTARLAAMDVLADPDGRYRINEFCCRDDTWQATVVELIERADGVVMDLRGFTVQRHGCEFELRQLGARLSPARIVLVVDASTDRALLAQVAPAGPAPMQVMAVERGSRRQTDAVFAALLRAAVTLA
jgi:hypothetical protein